MASIEMVNRHPFPRRRFAQPFDASGRLCLMKTKHRRHKRSEVTPVTMLQRELEALRRDLRATIRAYVARLESIWRRARKWWARKRTAKTFRASDCTISGNS